VTGRIVHQGNRSLYVTLPKGFARGQRQHSHTVAQRGAYNGS
jgi:hypothetical protein